MERAGSEARVLNSAKLPFIWDAPAKTDKEDAMKLEHLIEERRDEKLPAVPLPGGEEMERRKLPANYSREVKGRTRNINLLHAMFVHQGHTTIVRKNLAAAERRREAVQLLTGQEREEAEWILKHLELHDERIWVAVRSKHGGAVRERYLYKTAVKGLSKKKTAVAAGRRMAELMYPVLRNKSVYEPRPWTGARDDTAELTKLAEGA